MEPIENATPEINSIPAPEETADKTKKSSGKRFSSNILMQQVSEDEGGVPTDMYCPGCREEIHGSYLPIFFCPFCEIQIWRDDSGTVTNYEQKHTCPDCGHTFGELTDAAPNDFQRMVRSFEQKTESVFLGLDRIVNRIFA